MTEDLPSTASLRAFVHAARASSLKRAAAELHLSPSALSRQVQGLEEHLGVQLFIRRNPGLELTEVGSRYLAAVERALRELEQAGRSLGARAGRPLRVSALEAFTAKWLVPHFPPSKPHIRASRSIWKRRCAMRTSLASPSTQRSASGSGPGASSMRSWLVEALAR
jgi:LysR family transcriptional regulator, glycine cleavage system transcriptional activator